MKLITFSERSRNAVLHIEAPGCIVNIRRGLTDMDGHEITSVQVIPDRYIGEEWDLPDHSGVESLNVRVRKVSNG